MTKFNKAGDLWYDFYGMDINFENKQTGASTLYDVGYLIKEKGNK